MNKIFKIFVFAVALNFAFTACSKDDDINNPIDDAGRRGNILELTAGELAQAISYLKPNTDVTLYGSWSAYINSPSSYNNNIMILTGTTKEQQDVLYEMLNTNYSNSNFDFASYNCKTSLICFQVVHTFVYGGNIFSGGTLYVTDDFADAIGMYN